MNITQRLLLCLCVWCLSCCTPYQSTVVVVATPACGALALPNNALTCDLITDNQYLLRGNDAQAIIYGDVAFSVNGTLWITIDANTLRLAVLAGNSVVSAHESTRILSSGSQLVVTLNSDKPLDEPIPLEQPDISPAILAILPSDFVLPAPIAPPPSYTARPSITPSATPLSLTDIAIGTATPQATVCAPRLDWSGRYTIRRGDLLSQIARQYGLTLTELQEGNCISDPNRIPVGLTLNVPSDVTLEPSATLTLEATLTPSAVAFRADKTTLKVGECTTLRWDVFNISAVFIEESATTGNNLVQVCPLVTTSYTLRVVYPDGTQTTHLVKIDVAP
jgi:hypothetical protein